MMAAVTSQAARVTLEHVSKRFGKTVAVDDVSLQIEPGSLVTLLGPSGCGKTTILRMVAGLETVSSGESSSPTIPICPNARDVTMMFQSYALFPHLSVFENRVRPAGAETTGSGAAESGGGSWLVGMVGMGAGLNAPGGQQQRVAWPVPVMQPKVLLFDEPCQPGRQLRPAREEIRLLQQRLGITAIYVTHDQAEALAISDRIVVIEKGRIAQIGSPLELYRSPGNRFVAEFIGEELPAGAAGGDGRRPRPGRHGLQRLAWTAAPPGGRRHGSGAPKPFGSNPGTVSPAPSRKFLPRSGGLHG
jgi:iron(III) transport system ATP-binding protein